MLDSNSKDSNSKFMTKFMTKKSSVERIDGFNSFILFEMCGAIGCGKTAIVKGMEKIYNGIVSAHKRLPIRLQSEPYIPKMRFVYEDVTSTKCLSAIESYYNGTMSSVQMEGIITQQHITNLLDKMEGLDYNEIIISDRSIIEDLLFIDELYKRGSVEPLDSPAMESIVDNVRSVACTLNRHGKSRRILINTDIDECLRRISKRGRPFEGGINADTLKPLVLPREFCNLITNFDPSLSETACATAMFIEILNFVRTCTNPPLRDAGKVQPIPFIPKTLISLYGIPGVGKTFILKAIENLFDRVSWPEAPIIYDESDSKSRLDLMKAVYGGAEIPPNVVQYQIDTERYKSMASKVNLNHFLFTDVGSETSNIFAKVNNCNPPCIMPPNLTYSDAVKSMFGKELNINLHSGMEDVLKRINMRGRHNEYKGLTVGYLGDILKGIRGLDSINELEYDISDVFKILESILMIVHTMLSTLGK